MPFLLVLGPIFGVAVLVACVAHAHKAVPHPNAPRQFELDHGMPEAIVQQVLGDLVHEDDATKLEARASELARVYPIASRELQTKAASVRATPNAAAPSLLPAGPPSVPARPPTPSVPDMGEPALILQAAMKAFAQEADPVELEGFAESIRAKYPTAAVLLVGRARELRVSGAGVSPASPQAPGGATAPSTSLPPPASPEGMPILHPRSPSQTVAPTYVVQEGDTPTTIAQKLAHDAKRWPELVALNPAKPKTANGNFASLRAGETLHVPPSWGAAATAPAPGHSLPKETHA